MIRNAAWIVFYFHFYTNAVVKCNLKYILYVKLCINYLIFNAEGTHEGKSAQSLWNS